MKKFIYLLLLVLFAFPVFTVLAEESPAVTNRLEMYNLTLPQGYGLISAEDLVTKIAEEPAILLLDVRQPEEYEAGHLENSFNVPIRSLAQNLDLLPDLHASIVVICKSGGRATLAATSLGLLGYDNVKILKGGYGAWDGAELPTSTDVYTTEVGTAPEFDQAVFDAIDLYLSTLPEGFGFVSAQDLAVELSSDNAPLVIDVRGLEEWNAGYIDGSQHIWVNEFMSHQDEWPVDKDTPIVITCASGYRGSIATVLMRLAGYTNVRNLSGGTNAWTTAGFPLVGAVNETTEFDLNTYLSDYVAGLPSNFNAVRVDDLVAELSTSSDLMLVDVRTADEYAEGFIEGAVNIPLHELTQQLDLLPDLNQNIVVYCGSGHRSALAMTALNLFGYENTRSLMGGFGLWTSSGNPMSLEVSTHVAGTAPKIDPNIYEVVDNFMTSIQAGYYTVKDIDLKVELGENPPVLFDVRTDNEWQQGYIEGSIHLPLNEFMADQSEWPSDMESPIVIYDNPTHRSTMAMMLMRLMGYSNVRALAGGIGKWTTDMLPLVTD